MAVDGEDKFLLNVSLSDFLAESISFIVWSNSAVAILYSLVSI
jgi:hypothetical protein